MNPFYDALIGEMLMDPVPEQPGWFDPPTSMPPTAGRHEPDGDAQSAAYRGMTAADAVPDDEITAYAARLHDPLPDTAHPASHLLLPEDYEREQWDTGREDPR